MIEGKPTEGLFFRTNLASGTTVINGKDTKFEVSINIDNRAIFVEFPETKIQYLTEDIVKDAIEQYEKWLSCVQKDEANKQ